MLNRLFNEKKNEGLDFPERFVASDLNIVGYVNDYVSTVEVELTRPTWPLSKTKYQVGDRTLGPLVLLSSVIKCPSLHYLHYNFHSMHISICFSVY